MSEEITKEAGAMNSDTLKDIMPYLLSGGAGALAGGLVTGGRRKEKGEGRLGHLGRILRNAAIAGGLAGGGHYLMNQGLRKTVGGLTSASSSEAGPLETGTRNIAFSPVTAGLSGAAGLAVTRKMPGIGAGDGKRKDMLAKFLRETGATKDSLRGEGAKEIGALTGSSEKVRRAAGLPSDKIGKGQEFLRKIPGLKAPGKAEAVKGSLSTLGRKGLGTLGQSWPRRGVRGAVGLTAAGLPALLGSLVTSE